MLKRGMRRGLRVVLFFLVFISVFVLLGNILLYASYDRWVGVHGRATEGSVSFSIAEPATEEAESEDVGGGGGGGGIGGKKDPWTLDVARLTAKAKLGGSDTKEFSVLNYGETTVTFSFAHSLGRMLSLSESLLQIPGNGKGRVKVLFIAPHDGEAGVHTGEIVVEGKGIEKKLPVIFEVSAGDALFSLKLYVPPVSRTVGSGDAIPFQVELDQVDGLDPVDVVLAYEIQDFFGGTFFELEERVVLDGELVHTKTITFPDVPSGEYVLVVKATSGGATLVDSQVLEFDLELSPDARGFQVPSWVWIALVGMLGAGLVWMLWTHHGHGSHKGRGGPGGRRRRSSFASSLGLGELQGKLMALEEAKTSGLVKDSSYKKGKRSLSSKMRRRLGR